MVVADEATSASGAVRLWSSEAEDEHQGFVDGEKLVRVEASGGSAESLRIDDIRGSKFNLALGGADVGSMLLQARKALAIDRPELVVVQSIDHDITCDAVGQRPLNWSHPGAR